jgi:putative DNA primase/helicase
LPISFNADAACPLFEAFIKRALPHGDLRLIVQEMAGYLLVPDTSHQKAFLLHGKTQSGRSTLLKILQNMLGSLNVSHVPLERLGDRFMTAQLVNKLANFSSEVAVKTFVQDQTLKAVIAGDAITGENKNQPPFSFTPYARIVIACNEPPMSHDVNLAFFRRFLLLPFNQSIPEEEQDRMLDQKIIKNELAGVFLWCLAGLARLRKQGTFTVSQQSLEAMKSWRESLDPVAAFKEEFIRPVPGAWTSLQSVFDQFNSWCENTNRKTRLVDTNLKTRLENLGIEFIRRNPGQGMIDHALLPYTPGGN